MGRMIEADAVIEYIQLKSWQARQNDSWEGVKYADAIEDFVTLMPTINQWIPVTERLPEEEGNYFTTQIDENGKKISRVAYYENEWFTRSEVTAWMPLPEPYEEGAE